MTTHPENPFASPQAIDENYAEPSSSTLAHPEAMTRVRTGLRMVYISICGLLLSFFVAAGVGVFLAARGAAPDATAVLLLVPVGLLILGFYVLQLVGVGFCINAPPESGAKGLAIATLVLELLAFVFGVVAALANLLTFAAIICFLICMGRLAKYIERPDVASRARRAMIAVVSSSALVIVGALFAGVMAEAGAAPGAAAVIPLIVGLVGMLVGFLMYANTVTYLRKAIDEALAA